MCLHFAVPVYAQVMRDIIEMVLFLTSSLNWVPMKQAKNYNEVICRKVHINKLKLGNLLAIRENRRKCQFS